MDFALARRNMVDSQLRTNRVTDPGILDAMERLPREIFVPEALRGIAYVDEDIPVAPGRCLTEPMVLGRLLQLAEIGPQDRALVVGGGSGYGAAAAAALAREVTLLECDPALAVQAEANLHTLGIVNVAVVRGPLAEGVPAQAPFDAIVIDGAAAQIPDALVAQLAEDGRLVAVIRGSNGSGAVGKGTILIKSGGAVSRRVVFDAATPLLPGLEPKTGFVF